MSKGQTSGDATGWKRGEKGYASDSGKGAHRQWAKSGLLEPIEGSYKKELVEVNAVGQVATVGDGKNLKQRGY